MKKIDWGILFFILTVCTIPTPAFADFSFLWSPPQEDKSIEFLGMIFGVVSNVLNGSGSPLIGNLFRIFNIAVLSLGSIVVSYTIILSTINTAQEGEVMGRKWSSVWIPLRCAIGMACLLPTASGYSLIQVLIMQITVFGIAAADQVWKVAVESIGTKEALTGGVYMDTSEINDTTRSAFSAMMCARAFNTDPACQTVVNNQQVVFYSKDNNIYVGIPQMNKFTNVCGTFKISDTPKNVDPGVWQTTNSQAIASAIASMSPAIDEAYIYADPDQWHSQSSLASAADILKATIGGIPLKTPPPDNENNANLGWLYAGSFYFDFVSGGADNFFRTPSYTEGSTKDIGSTCGIQLTTYKTRATEYIASSSVENPISTSADANAILQLRDPGIKGGSELYAAITSPIRNLVFSLINYLTTNQNDPVSSLRHIGSNIMIVIETLWFFIILLAFILMLAACTMSGILPFCFVVQAIITVVLPVFFLILGLLWGVGALIGIYLPMVPYIVYTFTALGWFIIVIEAMAAAPVIALGLVSPASDTLGKAATSVSIIASVFLRPSLMVIGFMVSIQIVKAAIAMVNFGFVATVKASTGGLGIFGCIALLCLYGGLVIAIIHECFSLIHVLPDKVIRWIGGAAESTGVKSQLEEVKGATEKGTALGGDLMKGTAGKAEEISKETGKALGKRLSGGGDGGSGGGSGIGNQIALGGDSGGAATIMKTTGPVGLAAGTALQKDGKGGGGATVGGPITDLMTTGEESKSQSDSKELDSLPKKGVKGFIKTHTSSPEEEKGGEETGGEKESGGGAEPMKKMIKTKKPKPPPIDDSSSDPNKGET